MTMRLTFEIGMDVDIAKYAELAASCRAPIPDEVIRQGVAVKKTSPDMLAGIALTSTAPGHDTVYLSNYAPLRILDNVKRLPDVDGAHRLRPVLFQVSTWPRGTVRRKSSG
jgi:multidrug efflux pump subunit AcrB